MFSNNLDMQFNGNNLVFKFDCDTSYDDVFYLQYSKLGHESWFTLKISTRPSFSYEFHSGINIGDRFRCVRIRNAEISLTSSSVILNGIPSSVEVNEFIPDTFLSIIEQNKVEVFEISLRAYFINNTVAFKVTPSIKGDYTYHLQYNPKTSSRWYNVSDFKDELYRYDLPYFTQIGDLYRCVIKEGNQIICKSNEVQIFKPYEPEIGLEGKRTDNTVSFNVIGSDLTNCILQYRRSGNSSWIDLNAVTSSRFTYTLPETTRVGDAYRCVIKNNNTISKITNEIHVNSPYAVKGE